MRSIPLSRGQYAIVDDSDYETINIHKWSAMSGGVNGCTYYAVRNLPRRAGFPRKKEYMHHIVLPPKKGFETDHKDGDGLNNCRSNLRYATKSQNRANRRMIEHTSRFKGVHWSKRDKKWVASIRFHNKQKELGRFSKEVEAAKTYNEAAKKYHGEFCVLNKI